MTKRPQNTSSPLRQKPMSEAPQPPLIVSVWSKLGANDEPTVRRPKQPELFVQ